MDAGAKFKISRRDIPLGLKPVYSKRVQLE